MIEKVANDTGRDLELDVFRAGKANGDIICEAGIETGKIGQAGAEDDFGPRRGT